MDELIYFIKNAKGMRTARSYGRYNGGKEMAESKLKPGETVEEGRKCPYPGCYGDKDARPPCGLCYE